MRCVMKRFILAGIAGLFMTGTAMATDAPMSTEPGVTFDWTGFYVGATAGYGWGDYTLFSLPPGTVGTGPNVSVDGFVGGGTIGFNWQNDNWVLGIEADISSGPDGTTPVGTSGTTWACITGLCNADIEYFGTVRGRAGLATDRWLIFATGGLAYGHVSGGIFSSAQQGGGSATGWTAGVGTEFAFAQDWTAKLEYLHVDLGDIPFGTNGGGGAFKGRGDFDVVRGGINYLFGR